MFSTQNNLFLISFKDQRKHFLLIIHVAMNGSVKARNITIRRNEILCPKFLSAYHVMKANLLFQTQACHFLCDFSYGTMLIIPLCEITGGQLQLIMIL
jgi:hypothetical protein